MNVLPNREENVKNVQNCIRISLWVQGATKGGERAIGSILHMHSQDD